MPPKAEFDEYATNYQAVVEDSYAIRGVSPDLFASTKAIELARILPDGHSVTALDVGCGVGALHPALGPCFRHLVGVDLSEKSIEMARLANPGIEYSAFDGRQLPFADHSFDFAFAICVLHHVPPEQWGSLVAEMARVVAPGGHVAIIEHNPLNPLTMRTVARCPFDEDAVLLGHRKTEGLLQGAGLSRTHTRFFPFIPMEGKLPRLIDAGLAWLPLGAQYCSSAQVEY